MQGDAGGSVRHDRAAGAELDREAGEYLYCDGGVIHANPSPIGGTWAWIRVRDGVEVASASGVIPAGHPNLCPYRNVSNNTMEAYALAAALHALPIDWTGTICTDSRITLGRATEGHKMKGIPGPLAKFFHAQCLPFAYSDAVAWLLLKGHPSKAELTAGVSKKGVPVSAWNVWCDKAATEAGVRYWEALAGQAGQLTMTEGG